MNFGFLGSDLSKDRILSAPINFLDGSHYQRGLGWAPFNAWRVERQYEEYLRTRILASGSIRLPIFRSGSKRLLSLEGTDFRLNLKYGLSMSRFLAREPDAKIRAAAASDPQVSRIESPCGPLDARRSAELLIN